MAEENTPPSQRLIIRQRRPSFSKEQKVGFGLFFSIGGLAVILGTVYVARHLNQPFVIEYEGEPVLAGADNAAAQLMALQTTDTDGDGLNDYLEIYSYSTSPYLADTDGDGISDYDELQSGSDPNCVRGQDCETGSLDETEQSPSQLGDGFIDSTYDTLGISNTGEIAPMDESLFSDFDPATYLLENTSVDDMRAMFLAGGLTQEEVDALTDEEVRQLFEDAIKELDASGELDSVVSEVMSSQ